MTRVEAARVDIDSASPESPITMGMDVWMYQKIWMMTMMELRMFQISVKQELFIGLLPQKQTTILMDVRILQKMSMMTTTGFVMRVN